MGKRVMAVAAILFAGFALAQTTAQGVETAAGKQVEITYIGNEGFMIEGGGKKVLIDALRIDGAGDYYDPPAELKEEIEEGIAPFGRVDLHLVTHSHGDHFDKDKVGRQLQRNASIAFAGPKDTVDLAQIAAGLKIGDKRLIFLDPKRGGSIDATINGIKVKALGISHSGGEVSHNAYLIEINGMKILHLGDFCGFSELTELYELELAEERIDIAFVNFYCYTDDMSSSNLDSVLEGIGAKQVIMMHIELGMEDYMTTFAKGLGTGYPEIKVFAEAMEKAAYSKQ